MKKTSAFSLIELLVVVAIIIMLTALLVPAMRGISGATNLTSVTEEVASTFNLARQRASTFNRQVAVRFWREGGADGLVRSYQIWEQENTSDQGSWRSADRERRLPTGITVTNSTTFSPLLERFRGSTNNRSYSEVRFTPAGSVDANSQSNAITFVMERGPSEGGQNGLPPNYGVVVIETVNGIPTTYRPQ